ncbi:MAG: DUF362 domain-containing protein [Candidatus Omnitrophica bacterium]|nr:DUF362 domain-containing protein [Candidatus Omnitrophota bacterium]
MVSQKKMNSIVWYVPMSGKGPDIESSCRKLQLLIKSSGVLDNIEKDDFTCIKLHFGEKENTGRIRSELVREVASEVSKKTKNAFLSDTNVLYKNSSRTNSVDHLKTAHAHGFSIEKTGIPVIISDGLFGRDYMDILIEKKHFKDVKIARDIAACDKMVVLTHVTGHMYTGLGGAIKNLGMGCASRRGKYEQHSGAVPTVEPEFCVACGLCRANCPAGCIKMENGKANILSGSCIGCGECVVVCRTKAINIKWSEKLENLQEKMVEYAYGAVKAVEGNAVYISFLLKVTKNCDCIALDEPAIVEDMGILASRDPVAIDKASCDLINQRSGKDIFKEVNPITRWNVQIEYAAKIGLGNTAYTIKEI